MLTRMIVFAYESRWARLRNKPKMTEMVNSPHIAVWGWSGL
jgi:hypothetical protein